SAKPSGSTELSGSIKLSSSNESSGSDEFSSFNESLDPSKIEDRFSTIF
ncbi:6019_t:CDS:1, partial [Cetraspora pellucida]